MSGHFESSAVSDIMSFNPRLNGHMVSTFLIGSGKAQKICSDSFKLKAAAFGALRTADKHA
jgi:hypothetical protein